MLWDYVDTVLLIDWISLKGLLKCDHSNESYRAVFSWRTLYYVVGSLFWVWVDEILKCDHSNESYWAELSSDAVYHAVKGGPDFFESVTVRNH